MDSKVVEMMKFGSVYRADDEYLVRIGGKETLPAKRRAVLSKYEKMTSL